MKARAAIVAVRTGAREDEYCRKRLVQKTLSLAHAQDNARRGDGMLRGKP